MSVTLVMSVVLSAYVSDSWNLSVISSGYGSVTPGKSVVYLSGILVTPGMSVVLSGYISDPWSVNSFFVVYESFRECQWFYPGISVIYGMSLASSSYISDAFDVTGFIRVCQ